MTEQVKVPEIRFAGFTDPWEQRKLGELEKDATLYMGRGRVISAKDMSNTPGTFPVYSSSALDNGRMGAYGKYMFNQELITWSIDGGGAVFYRRKHRFSVTNVSGYIAVNPEKINCKFLAYAMSLAHSRIKFDYTVKAHPSVIRSLYTMGIPISLQEQQVIGSFFSRLDNLITLHQRKYDKLVVFKKSMLEKMFPKDGESVPEIRFAGFTDPWEQRKLGEIASFSKGSGYSKADIRESGIPLFLYGRMYTQYETRVDSVDTFAAPRPGTLYSKGTEIVVPASGESAEDIARASAITREGIALGGDLNVVYPQRMVTPLFLAYGLSHGSSQKLLAQKAQGKTVVHIHASDLKGLGIAFPDVTEQQAIGTFFSSLDDLITLHQRKLELLRNIKKSLLDKMFV